jgi:hypothetical protein
MGGSCSCHGSSLLWPHHRGRHLVVKLPCSGKFASIEEKTSDHVFCTRCLRVLVSCVALCVIAKRSVGADDSTVKLLRYPTPRDMEQRSPENYAHGVEIIYASVDSSRVYRAAAIPCGDIGQSIWGGLCFIGGHRRTHRIASRIACRGQSRTVRRVVLVVHVRGVWRVQAVLGPSYMCLRHEHMSGTQGELTYIYTVCRNAHVSN